MATRYPTVPAMWGSPISLMGTISKRLGPLPLGMVVAKSTFARAPAERHDLVHCLPGNL